MFEFANPGFLAAGGALVSSPIIIHLINRIRYRRIRWAAMEFLLKSQKKNRRRLIIEQLILLALRCLLVILALMLVARLLKISLVLPSFLGGGRIDWTLGPTAKQKTVHLVLLDDSPSMMDEVDDPNRSRLRTCFDVAKEVIQTEIADNAAGSSTPQDLELVVLSRLAVQKDKYEPLVFHDLRDDRTREKLKEAIADLKCTSLHAPLLQAVTLAQQRAEENKDSQVVVHFLGDFRRRDWAGGEGSKTLSQAVVQLANTRAKVNLIDTAHPYRKEEKTAPISHDNVCISQFYPESRVVANGSLVRFNLVLHNYSDVDKEVRIALWDPESAKRLLQHEQPISIKVPKQGEVNSSIDMLMSQEKDGFFRVAAELEMLGQGRALDDGLPGDNVRHAAVYVRSTVPILIVDGDPETGKKDGGDSFHIEEALKSAPGAEEGFDIEITDDKGLDQPNLSKYLSIFLVNVPSLSDKQQKNLETYVWNGGSVAIFVGSKVDPVWYNEHLYKKDGKGLFPVELADTFTPPRDQAPLAPNLDDNNPKILVREDKFPNKDKYPIFGEILKNDRMRGTLNLLPIWRFYEIKNMSTWKPVPGEIDELATMPNLNKVSVYAASAGAIRDELKRLAGLDGNEKYAKALKAYAKLINDALGAGKDCNELADALGKLKNDRGDEESAQSTRPSMVAFLGKKENERLQRDINDLWNSVRYGSPLVLASKYNRGRVVTVLTTAGKDWNGWPALASYVTALLEMHSYMTSLGEEANLTVGTARALELDSAYYDRKYKRTRPLTTFLEKKLLARKPKSAKKAEGRPGEEKKEEPQEEATRYETKEETAEEDPKQQGKIRLLQFDLGASLVPGFYRLDLTRKKDEKNPEQVEERGFVFNLDTVSESDLQRMGREALMEGFQGAPEGKIELFGPFDWGVQLANRQSDFSQTPWFYLLFLLILVAEQAMAVHLSFHLRDNTAALPTQAVRSQSLAA
jgi:hypothetical protein